MFQTIFGIMTSNDASCYLHKVNRINKFEEQLKLLDDTEIQEKTTLFLERLSNGQTLDSILEEAFAVAREASFRVLGLRQFDTQLVGGLVLHEGNIAEMATGEGKTLVSILPTYTNALMSKGVHVITVNSYLASRDAKCAGRVHEFLGLTVGVVDNKMSREEKRTSYLKDITYTTNYDLSFDYLKDNLSTSLLEIVQRPFHFCILDEADSILIDEAKTPLVISENMVSRSPKYAKADELARILERGFHYDVDEKSNGIILTEKGSVEVERFLKTNDLYKNDNPWAPYVFNALKSKEFFFKNVHYILIQQEVIIIDHFTGRAMPGRRWGEGLHQAIETKEKVPTRGETSTLASITYQNFFLIYPKLSGMTGTAKSEETELSDIYGLDVVCIPSHKKMMRNDYEDVIYQTENAKWEAVLTECLDVHSFGRPVLVGATSIKTSELLSSVLKKRGIEHNLLNAKPENVDREADIISQAGEVGSITIATNMAGRGTDILLGGNASYITKCTIKNLLENTQAPNKNSYYKLKNPEVFGQLLNEKLKHTNYKRDEIQTYLSTIDEPTEIIDQHLLILRAAYFFLFEKVQKEVLKNRKKIISLGGLHVIGTERHISKRIDDQLRGRSGRQGDPGSSRFFLSLEDDLFRVFGTESIKNLLKSLQIEPSMPIESKVVNSQLRSIQKKVEDHYYYIRKQTFEYDKVLNIQREVIYFERRKMLESIFLKKWILRYTEQLISESIQKYYRDKNFSLHARNILANRIKNLLNAKICINKTILLEKTKKDVEKIISQDIRSAYDLRKKYIDVMEEGLMQKMEYLAVTKEIDNKWKDHLVSVALLKDNVGWRAYAQKDPLIEYKNESHKLFLSMTSKIKHAIVYLLFSSKINIYK